MFSPKNKSPSDGMFGSKIGAGARKNVSPIRQQQTQEIQPTRASGHFGPSISPVNDGVDAVETFGDAATVVSTAQDSERTQTVTSTAETVNEDGKKGVFDYVEN